MSISQYGSMKFTGTVGSQIPDGDGDLIYEQDRIRDFAWLWDRVGQLATDIAAVTAGAPFLVSGGIVTDDGSHTKVNISAGAGYAPYQIALGYTMAVPPLTQYETLSSVRVSWGALSSQGNINTANTWYVKMAYAESDSLTRTRIKAGGSWAFTKAPSYTLTINTTAPASSEILLATIVSTGSTFTSITQGNFSPVVPLGAVVLTSGSPYSLQPFFYGEVIVNASTNPYVVNLPKATGSGFRVKIVNVNSAAAGLVQIAPNGTDKIGPAGNVSIYLQNTDQGGNLNYFQSVELLDALSGYWVVTGGQYCPHQTADTDGQQYHFGKFIHLPTGNTVDRGLLNAAPTATSTWYASPISGATKGVPAGAKGIRAKVYLDAYATAAGIVELELAFSDNNSFSPGVLLSHPTMGIAAYASAAGQHLHLMVELDIPLNASGNFYMYTWGASNVTIGSSVIIIAAAGYYMGD